MDSTRNSKFSRALAAWLLLVPPADAAIALVIADSTCTLSGISIAPRAGIAGIEPWTVEGGLAGQVLNPTRGKSDPLSLWVERLRARSASG